MFFHARINQQAILPLILAAAWCIPPMAVNAQTVLVETATLTASRESVRVYLQQLRLDDPTLELLPVQMPGDSPAGPIFLAPDSSTAITATRIHRYGNTADILAGISLATPRIPDRYAQSIGLLNQNLAGLVNGNAQESPRAVVVGTLDSGPLAGHGRIDAWPYQSNPSLSFHDSPATWLLPGAPFAALTHPTANWAAVLCMTPAGTTVLHVRDMLRGRILQERMPIAGPREQLEPAALALRADSGILLAVLNYTSTEGAGGEGRCHAVAIDARSFTRRGDVVELPGLFTQDCQIEQAANDAWWISTRTPGAGFAFVTRLVANGETFEQGNQYSFTSVTHNVRIASSGTNLAVSVDRRLAIWPNGVPGSISVSYATPISAIDWAGDLVIASEANRIHGVRASDGDEVAMCAVQSGHVVALRALPPNITLPVETDGDRIADSVDPEPGQVSPHLDLPSRITLRAEAAGREVRAIRIDAEHAGNAVWTVDVDPQHAPWLRVFPRHGTVPGWFLAGIDPSQLFENNGATATIAVSLSGTTPKMPAANSPRRITVDIRPRSADAKKILWLLGANVSPNEQDQETGNGPENAVEPGNPDFAALARVLAGPPFYFSHVYPNGRAPEVLVPYGAVVVDTGAIDRGIVNRQALLDYVADGGGLLLVAGMSTAAAPVSQRWLSPLGIVLDGEGLTADKTKVVAQHKLTQNWPATDMSDAARIQVGAGLTVLAQTGDVPVFAIRPFGRGRLAVLAAPNPLFLNPPSLNRAFTLDLFEWLSRAILESADLDDDGLPDSLEDRNGNGIVDPGETSQLIPDSDGDGLPDGAEDQNADGIADENETSPIHPDSDGDGNWDGADYDPLPPAGAPTAAAFLPNTGPAEGGTRVIIDGRNLTADTAIWFGAHPARIVRLTNTTSLLVESPPADEPEGGPVDVRIEGAGAQSTILTGAFTYTPRSSVMLSITAVAASRTQYEALVTLRLDAPPGVRIGRIAARLDSEPPMQMEWSNLRPTPDATLAGRRVVQDGPVESGIAFTITAPTRAPDAKDLITVSGRSRFPLTAGPSVSLTLNDITVTAPNGAPLDVEIAPIPFQWPSRTP
ncbi:MAG: IPT/TIG domain-containing protein [Candidatus Hydrogenedentes bacterium]|nr:IPT/TIG domain-containing protein [Candidatus Hydrogenedentota bacterium]